MRWPSLRSWCSSLTVFTGPSDTIPVTFLHSCWPWPLVPLVFNQGDTAPGYRMFVGVSGTGLVSAPPHPGFHTNLQSEGTSATTAQNLSFLFCSSFAFLCSLLSGSLSAENCRMELEHVILITSKIRHRWPSELSLSDSRCLCPGQILSQILQLITGQSPATKRPHHRKSSSIFVLFFFFLPVLLRCNGHTALHKCKVCSKWFDGVHHEMILTISLVNVHHLPQTQNNRKRKHSSCDENSAPLLTFLSHHKPASRSQSGSSVQTTSSLGLGEWLPQQHRTGPWRFLGHLLPSGRTRRCSCDPRIWKPPPSQHKCFLTTTKVGDRHRCCFRRLS